MPRRNNAKTPDSKAMETFEYMKEMNKWYSWGSPVGLVIFFVGIGVLIELLHLAGLIK